MIWPCLKKAGLYPEFLGANKGQLSFMYWTTLWLSAAYQRAKSGSFILTVLRLATAPRDKFGYAGGKLDTERRGIVG